MLKEYFNNNNPSIDDIIGMFILEVKDLPFSSEVAFGNGSSNIFINDYEKINVTLSNKSEDILACDDMSKDKKNLVIFDDVVNNKDQSIQKSYFTRGRHNNVNVIYISQTYFDIDKNSIRNNSNCFIFFKLDKKDRDLIFSKFNIIDENKQKIINHLSVKYNYFYYSIDDDEIIFNLFK